MVSVAADLCRRLRRAVESPGGRVERLTVLVPDLVRLFEEAGAQSSANADPEQDNWLWTGRRPDSESQARGAIVEILGELGADAAVAVSVLLAALGDFAVCRNRDSGKVAEQEHVCFHAAYALGKIGPAAIPALGNVRESQAICHRFFEPFAAPTGDLTRLGELATEILEQMDGDES